MLIYLWRNRTTFFIIISGASVLVWLQFIIPAVINGSPLENTEIYTTEPTFVLDLAIMLPLYLGCGIALLKRNTNGYKLTPILLTFIVIIGLTVVGQTIVQINMGIDVKLEELIGLVVSFIILGVVGMLLNIKYLSYLD